MSERPSLVTSRHGTPDPLARLRRDLGLVESYAALLGILIGGGIFKVTSEAWVLTGSSVILAHALLAVPVLATSVGYSVYLSTPLGEEPGGEYAHIAHTFGGLGLAFVGAWLKIISYIGALAFLSLTFADYLLDLVSRRGATLEMRMAVAFASLVFFLFVHVAGVRWFGRLQVWMMVILGLSLAVLIVPGLFAIHGENFPPFFRGGAKGFASALPPLFFAYAGFESLAQTAGETAGSRDRLPGVFLRGIAATAIIYVLLSIVAFGVLPGARLQASAAPMAEVGAQYLSLGAAWFVTVGALMALATSINGTMLVPSRLALVLVRDGLAPAWLGIVSANTGTPVPGLLATFAAAVALLLSGQVSLALNIAVIALVGLYLIHSVALLVLPRRNPGLFSSATTRLTRPWQLASAWVSVISMAALIILQFVSDLRTVVTSSFAERVAGHRLTSLELLAAWAAVGAGLYLLARRQRDS